MGPQRPKLFVAQPQPNTMRRFLEGYSELAKELAVALFGP
jgi:hypothetical protein